MKAPLSKKAKEGIAAAIFCGLLLCVLVLASWVLIPARTEYGSTWGSFAAEQPDSIQAMFFGSSLVYCDVIPAVIWQESGVASYVMAGPEQTFSTTYYYIKQALQTQSPSVLFIEATGIFYPRYTGFTKVNIGYMPFSFNRLEATFAAAEKEQWCGLLFPPFNYHDRWDQLTAFDFKKAVCGYPADEMAGYTFLDRIAKNDMDKVLQRTVEFDQETYDLNISYLHKIASLCAEKKIACVFYLTPSYLRLADTYLEMLAQDMPTGENIRFIDFNANFDDLGIDNYQDFYDHMHFNYRGAEKFSASLAQLLSEYQLSPAADTALWQNRLDAYHAKVENTN